MDPLTQGLLGAAASQALLGKRLGPGRAALLGAAGGMLPDADVLIRSSADPLLAIEYHRQFTHALSFIPIGGAIAALPFLLVPRMRADVKGVFAAAIAGYATHGLLDACTTYGTLLLWPFSNARIAWDWISIIDPIFTLALLIGVIVAIARSSRIPAIAGLLFCLSYIGFGAVQHSRALDVQLRLARLRGHEIVRGETFPTIGNNIVWRSLYSTGQTLHADRIRVPWFGRPGFSEGTSVPLVTEAHLEPELRSDPRIARDFRRFRWFSDGWVARAPDDQSVIGDARYSLRTDRFDPIWGIRFHPGEPVPTEWVNRTRDRELGVAGLWNEMRGAGTTPLPK